MPDLRTDRWTDRWDERYSEAGLYYGHEPNAFLVAHRDDLPPGRVLCPGDGEGRNGIWLAQQGWAVTAVDYSRVGLEKARTLAAEAGVTVELVHANIIDYDPAPAAFDAIVNIFLHMEGPEIALVHRNYARLLRPGGVLLAEIYSKRQLQYGSGGPRSAEALYETDYFRRDFPGWETIHLAEEVIRLNECPAHRGAASVVRAILRKPPTLGEEQ